MVDMRHPKPDFSPLGGCPVLVHGNRPVPFFTPPERACGAGGLLFSWMKFQFPALVRPLRISTNGHLRHNPSLFEAYFVKQGPLHKVAHMRNKPTPISSWRSRPRAQPFRLLAASGIPKNQPGASHVRMMRRTLGQRANGAPRRQKATQMRHSRCRKKPLFNP